MNPSSREGWPPPPRPAQSSGPPGREYQPDSRSLPPSGPGIQSQQSQGGGPVLPPPPAQFYPSNQPGGHSLAPISGLGQSSPPQNPQGVPPQPLAPQMQHQQPPQGSGYALPAIGAVQHQQGHSEADRDRMMHQREMDERLSVQRDAAEREREREREQHRNREAQRAAEARDQYEMNERRRIESQNQPHQTHAGSIPIHQPVASKVPSTIHGPGGLLSGLGGGAGPAPSTSIASSNGPSGGYGPPNPNNGNPRPAQQNPSQNPQLPQHRLMQAPGAMTGLTQGQQPILNDALSYLDQVKVQFVDQSDVYNRFLDIMKDFKSQAIDTPGVIDRVSNLFAGHPNLIQGFNTFLPPGYRIECGMGDDPNAIRVTTPQGSTNLSMSTGLRLPPEADASGQSGPYYDRMSQNTNGAWQPNAEYGPNGRRYSPDNRQGMPGVNQQAGVHPANAPYDGPTDQLAANAATLAHQQEQQGVSQLQNAVTAATNGPGRGALQEPPMASGGPLGGPMMNGQLLAQAGQAGLDKRGPVEFNHAISYVNKIKNRFASQPEIYKQFLEILQTYQRESKPIQDVYAQVTQLFNSAPDLLEDFKQFLPESAAQAKAQAAAKQAAEDAAMLSDVRGEPGYLAAGQNQISQHSGPKMPPVGNFAPPPVSGSDRKKRKNVPGSTGSTSAQATFAGADMTPSSQIQRNASVQASNAAKRKQPHPTKPVVPEAPPVEPTLTPALPEPIPPTTSSDITEQIAYFDKFKKFIGNKQTFNEFLKLCNLFTQDLIDADILVYKASSFIGGSPDLLDWFKNWVGATGKDSVIENRPRAPTGRVTLSNCRGYGPSYRLLPKRERFQVCSGRDELCRSVLNDEWASHPTWASEDSGFVAHRKNTFEEQLHRIEEERHDYDYNVQAAERTIQLLEPIAIQIEQMSVDEQVRFQLDPRIGGTSTTIYQRLIKKVYGREAGQHVIDGMFANPCMVIPFTLSRIKERMAKWKASQREWEKVWREGTAKNFYKSLDHMGINAKGADKRQFQQKQLLAEIQTKRTEQERQRSIPFSSVPNYQFQYAFADSDIVIDIAKLLLIHINHSHQTTDKSKLDIFVREFIPTFFGIAAERLEENGDGTSRRSPVDEDMEDVTESTSAQGRQGASGKKSDLLRDVLERGRTGRQGRNDQGSAASDSKESTPDVGTLQTDETSGAMETDDQDRSIQLQSDNWLRHPESTAALRTKSLVRQIPPYEAYSRDTYSLYCNANVYTFFRLFQILYDRLSLIKQSEQDVADDIRRAKMSKPARDLKMIPFAPESYFSNTGPDANYYRQVLDMCEDVLEGRLDMTQFEDALRHYYMQNGWKLYSVDKLVSAIARTAGNIVNSELRDKSNELVQLFLKDREKPTTTHKDELTYRKQVEKLVKDGDGVFRIAYNTITSTATIQLLNKEDTTFDVDGMTPSQRWSYYTASFITRQPTEGLPTDRIRMPFLERNRPGDPDDDEDPRVVPVANHEGLLLRICVNSYRMLYDVDTEDWFVQSGEIRGVDNKAQDEAKRVREKRAKAFKELIADHNTWIKDSSKEDVQKTLEAYEEWITGHSAEKAVTKDGEEDNVGGDFVMVDA